MQTGTKVNIEDYIELYNEGLKLDKFKPMKNSTYKLFRSCKTDIRIVHRSKTYNKPQAYSKIKYFIKDNEYFYMIPITTVKEKIVGFILRGVLASNYSTIYREFSDSKYQIPLMFGFDKSFQDYDAKSKKYGKCLPIIVCEGSKDCLALKKIYPYVVANNTSSMGLNLPILRQISKSFLLAYDNDKAGKDGIKKDKEALRRTGAYVESLKLDDDLKDCADHLKYPEKFKALRDQIKKKVNTLFRETERTI